MPLPPLRRANVFAALPLALVFSALAAMPAPPLAEDAATGLFTAPLACDAPAPISTWFDHDARPGLAVNWGGAIQNLLRQPFADGHNGTDYAVDSVPVRAIAAGVVRETRRDAMGALVVAVDHPALDHLHQYQSRYVHLRAFAVSPGQPVAQGEVVGVSGNTGLSSGPHLHLTLLEDGRPIDPYARFWRDGRAPCPPAS